MDESAASSSSTRGRSLSDVSSEDEYEYLDYDIANTHDCNEALRKRPAVSAFFDQLRDHESLADRKTQIWLGELPFHMRNGAIPLFADGEESQDHSVDYQLHPAYTTLELHQRAAQPHREILRLSMNGELFTYPRFVVGIGRLFINLLDRGTKRLSKWTGYELFVDEKLALWMVFNEASLKSLENEWYPVSCRLTSRDSRPRDTKEQPVVVMLDRKPFRFACVIPSIKGIPNAKFGLNHNRHQLWDWVGTMMVNQVDRQEIDEFLKADRVSPEIGPPAIASEPDKSTMDPRRVSIVKQSSDEMGGVLLDAVQDVGEDRKFDAFLGKYKDNITIIQGVITTRVLNAAAVNEIYGDHIVSILLLLFEAEVCNNISTETLKAIAGNRQHGAQIMTAVMYKCEDVVYKLLTADVISVAVQNKSCGLSLLRMLYERNPTPVLSLMSEIVGSSSTDSRFSAGTRSRLIEYSPYIVGDKPIGERSHTLQVVSARAKDVGAFWVRVIRKATELGANLVVRTS